MASSNLYVFKDVYDYFIYRKNDIIHSFYSKILLKWTCLHKKHCCHTHFPNGNPHLTQKQEQNQMLDPFVGLLILICIIVHEYLISLCIAYLHCTLTSSSSRLECKFLASKYMLVFYRLQSTYVGQKLRCIVNNHSVAPPHQHKFVVVYCTSYHRLVIETSQWSTILVPRDSQVCHFCSYNELENKGHFVLEWPLYKSIKDKFQLLFENVVFVSLESVFRLNHRVDIKVDGS